MTAQNNLCDMWRMLFSWREFSEAASSQLAAHNWKREEAEKGETVSYQRRNPR
jgi:hypothetical protein